MLLIGPNWLRRDGKKSRETSFQAARALEFALLRGGIQWLDGLVLFSEWLERGQDETYETLMGVQISKANGALTDVGLNEPHLKRHGEQIWRWYGTDLTELPESNVSASVELAKSAKALFHKGHVRTACARLTQAYGWWFDAHGIAEAVCAAPDTADAMQELAKLPDSVVNDLQTYATRLLFAIGAVWGATRTDREQFQPEMVTPVLSEWIDSLGCVAEAIRRMRSGAVEAPAPIKDDLQQFVELAKRYTETLPEPDRRAYRKRVWRRPPPSRRRRASRERTKVPAPSARDQAEEVEHNQLLEELVDCALVSKIRLALRTEREDYARGWLDTRDDRNAVRTSLHEFLSSREPIESKYLLAKLRRRIRLTIARERAGEVLEVRERRPWAAHNEVEKTLEALLTGALDLDAAIRTADSAIQKDLGSNTRTLIRRALRQRQSKLPIPKGLQPLKDELKSRSHERTPWFPKDGPTAADFRDGRVCRTDDLIDRVREKLVESRVVLLEGERATGKSVLACWLAHDWTDGEFEDGYYLDCLRDSELDVHELARFIKQSDALLIFENMHLLPDKFQQLWATLNGADLDGYVLFTARPIPRADTKLEPLQTLPTVQIRPYAYADNVIRGFAARADCPRVFDSDLTRRRLREIGDRDYWLLSYALAGCDKQKGEGEPISWVEDGVRGDLGGLELINPRFPQVLLSLAPLAMNETLTSESYLTTACGCSREDLLALMQRGEVVRTERHGQFLYGLPHASLAVAYWTHGEPYRENLPECGEFIYAYAASGASNGLEAVGRAFWPWRDHLRKRLIEEGRMKVALAKERSSDWVNRCLGEWPKGLAVATEVGQVLDERLARETDPYEILAIIASSGAADAGLRARLWASVNKRALARSLVDAFDAKKLGSYLGMLFYRSPVRSATLWDLMGTETIARLLVDAPHPEAASAILWPLCLSKGGRSAELAAQLDVAQLAARLNARERLSDAGWWLKALAWASPDKADRLWTLLDCQRLAAELSERDEFQVVGWTVMHMFEARSEFGSKLWSLMNRQLLADRLINGSLREIQECLFSIERGSEDAARELCALLGPTRLAARIAANREWNVVLGLVQTLVWLDKSLRDPLCQAISWVRLAGYLRSAADQNSLGLCTNRAMLIDPKEARQLWEYIGPNDLARNVNQPDGTACPGWLYASAAVAAPLVAEQALPFVKWSEVAASFSRMSCDSIVSGLGAFASVNSDIPRKLCEELNLRDIIQVIAWEPLESSREACLSAIEAAHPAVGKALRRLVENAESD